MNVGFTLPNLIGDDRGTEQEAILKQAARHERAT